MARGAKDEVVSYCGLEHCHFAWSRGFRYSMHQLRADYPRPNSLESIHIPDNITGLNFSDQFYHVQASLFLDEWSCSTQITGSGD